MKLNLIFLVASCLIALSVGSFVIWLNSQKAEIVNDNQPTRITGDN